MWKSKNDSCTVCWPFRPNPQSPPVPWITLALSDDPTETTQTRFVASQVCLQCWGSQEVRMVEGGVRRWEADGGRHISGGGRGQIWWQGFSCLEQPWHYDIVDSQKHTLAHPAQRHGDPVTSSTSSQNLRSAFRVCFKRCCSNAECVKGRDSARDLWF